MTAPKMEMEAISRETKLANAIKDVQLDSSNILETCFKLMNVAESFVDLPGPEKKKMVLDSLMAFAKSRNVPDIILSLIPSFIDMAIAIKNGDLTFDKVEKQVKACCGCF